MGVMVNYGDLCAEVAQTNSCLQSYAETAERCIGALETYCGESGLSGAAYANSKQYFSNTYAPIMKQLILVCQEMSDRNNQILSSFSSNVPTTYGFAADTDVIEAEIARLKNENEYYRRQIDTYSNPVYLLLGLSIVSGLITYYYGCIFANNLLISKYQKVVDGLYAFDGSCAGAFDESAALAKQIAGAISLLGGNFHNGRYSIPSDMAKRLMEIEYERMVIHNADGSANYDFEFIKGVMAMSPYDVPKELYAAMIYAFNKMTLIEKEQFIESSYILGDFWPDSSQNIGAGKFEYEISDVYLATVAAYADLLGSNSLIYEAGNSDVEKLIGNYSLMQAASSQGGKIYVSGFYFAGLETINPLDVTLESGTKENDYSIKYNGSSSPYNEYGMPNYSEHEISSYGMRNGDGIDSVFHNQSIELAESLRVDIGQKNFENVVAGVSDILLSFIDIPSVASAEIAASSMIIDCTTTTIEGEINNNTIDKIQNLLSDANTYKALWVTASFSISDGEYQLAAFTLDKEHLDVSIEKYRQETGKNVKFTAESIVENIQQRSLSGVSGLSDYVDWFMNCGGNDKTYKYFIDEAGRTAQ